MKTAVGLLLIAVLLAPAATAQSVPPFECVWRGVPNANLTMRGGSASAISSSALLAAIKQCGVSLTGPTMLGLGLYFTARHHVEDDGASLVAKYPYATQRLQAASLRLSADDRTKLLAAGLSGTAVPDQTVEDVRRAAGEAQIPAADIDARNAAARYLISEVEVYGLTR